MKTTIKGTVLWINNNAQELEQKVMLVEPIQYKRNGNVFYAKNGIYAQTRRLGLFHRGSNGIMITKLADAAFTGGGLFE